MEIEGPAAGGNVLITLAKCAKAQQFPMFLPLLAIVKPCAMMALVLLKTVQSLIFSALDFLNENT